MTVARAEPRPAGATPSLEEARALAHEHNLIPVRETFVEEVLLAPSERAVVDVLFDRPGEVQLEHRTPGHTYQLGTGGSRKDTTIVLPKRTVSVYFDADNPGQWMLHCHNTYHLEAGMMTRLDYLF